MECKAFRGRDAKGKRLKSLKNILPFCIAIILIAQSCYPIPSKRKLNGRIVKHFKDNYQVDVEVVKVTRALHLDWNSFKYRIRFTDYPLITLSGLYNVKENYFLKNDIYYALSKVKLSAELRDLLSFNKFVVIADLWINDDDVDYKNLEAKDLVRGRGEKCKLKVHVYCFDYANKSDIEWQKLQPLIEYFKQLSEVIYSFSFAFYDSSTFNNEDVFANDFGFGFKYVGNETNFEGRNLDKRIDNIENNYLSIDSLEAQWNAKLLEVEMQNKKD